MWDAKFETPLLARTLPPTDQEGKLVWTNMNTVERLNLLPSLNEVNVIDVPIDDYKLPPSLVPSTREFSYGKVLPHALIMCYFYL